MLLAVGMGSWSTRWRCMHSYRENPLTLVSTLYQKRMLVPEYGRSKTLMQKTVEIFNCCWEACSHVTLSVTTKSITKFSSITTQKEKVLSHLQLYQCMFAWGCVIAVIADNTWNTCKVCWMEIKWKLWMKWCQYEREGGNLQSTN